jgi:RNA polymerase sigma-70 factor (ECF subfamily)
MSEGHYVVIYESNPAGILVGDSARTLVTLPLEEVVRKWSGHLLQLGKGGCLMPATPRSLLQRLRTPGDAKSWECFVELYTPLLFFWAHRAGLRNADAADVVQDVFTVLVRKLPEFEYDPSKCFRNWLRTLTINKCRDALRKRAVVERSNAEVIETIAAAETDPFWEVEYRQMLVRRLLEIMKSEFDPSTWQACWKCVVESRKAPDVARELGLTPGAVRAAKFRVLCRLRAELNGLLE